MLSSTIDIVIYAIFGLFQLFFALILLFSSGLSGVVLTGADEDSPVKLGLCLVISDVILFFAARYLSTAVNALWLSKHIMASAPPGRNFQYLVNEILINGNGWMRTEYINGSWLLTLLAGIGLVILWIITIIILMKSFDSIMSYDDERNREIAKRNAAKPKKLSLKTRYEYNHINNTLYADTRLVDNTNYEPPEASMFTIFVAVIISLICMPFFTLVAVTLGYIIWFIKLRADAVKYRKKK